MNVDAREVSRAPLASFRINSGAMHLLISKTMTPHASGYWYVNCHVCGQGRLFVEVREDTGELILQCEECSRAWNSPSRVADLDTAFLAIELSTHLADRDEI